MTTKLFKSINHKRLILALLLFCSSSLWAYDYSFTAVNTWTIEDDEGNVTEKSATIYYIINEDVANTVSVIYYNLPSDTIVAGEDALQEGVYSGDVVIPQTVENNSTTYTVTGIHDAAFKHCFDLTSVTIPEGIKTIGEKAFFRCTSLTTLDIPYGVTSIGDDACDSCVNLKEIHIPTTVIEIGFQAFANCTSLESADSLQGVTSLGEKAFINCTSLKSVTLGEGLTTIEDQTFQECTSLESVTIPSSVTTIKFQAFYDCVSLEGAVDISSVTTLGAKAFYYCEKITSVTFSENLKTIDTQTFQHCIALTSVTIPNSVTTINNYAFYECTGITSLTLSNNLTTLGNQVFYKCESLTEVTIPSSITTWGDGDFQYCYKLASVTLTDGLASIGKQTFYGCTSLTEITIPSSINTIGDQAFFNCSVLETVYEKRSIDKLEESGVPTAGTDCFTNTSTSCFLVVPENAARYWYDTSNKEIGYGATEPKTDDGWETISYLREDTVTIPITTAEGYVTRYSPYSYILEEGLEGGVISVNEDGDLHIDWKYKGGDSEENNIVPAGSAILIKGPKSQANDVSFANETKNTDYALDSLTVISTGSMMYGTVDPNYNQEGGGLTDVPDDENYSASNYYFYKLSYYTNVNGVEELGFYMENADGSPFAIGGGDDYDSGVKLTWLAVKKESVAKAVRTFYSLDENSTGIESIEAAQPNDDVLNSGSDIIYNLQGMMVKEMTKKGIYIVNGKKVLR